MKKTLIISTITLLMLGSSLGYFVMSRPAARGAATAAAQQTKDTDQSEAKTKNTLIAAPGVVEAVSEEIEIGAEIPGKLKNVLVEEGDFVAKNQIIAVLENADYGANVATAKAEIETLRRQRETARARLAQAGADRTRISNGARVEERREARAGFEQTLPSVENAERETERRSILFEKGDISREDYERSRRDLNVAQKNSLEAKERYNVVNAAARQDDLQKADAVIRLAEAQIGEFEALIETARTRVRAAEAAFAKTTIRSPINGVILRKRLKEGESVSPENLGTGIVTVGDISALRIRVDIDEIDVAKIKPGQTAYVIADAYGEQKFRAKVVRIGQILGRKNVRTDEPTEKVDQKILEVLLELEPNQKLPLGLRVDAFINPNK